MEMLKDVQGQKLTKELIESRASELTSMMTGGESSALRLYIQLKAVYEMIGKVLKDPEVKDAAIEEARGYSDRDSLLQGARFRIKGTAKKWDFSNSEEWVNYQKEIDTLTEARKGLEAGLKAVTQSGMNVANMETGEEMKAVISDHGSETIEVRFS